MASSATLATLRVRIAKLLADTSYAIIPSATIDEGIGSALDEYNRYRFQEIIGTVTPSAQNKLVSLSALTGLLDVSKVWFPYTASAPEDPPRELPDWYLEWDAAVPKLYLGDSALSPNGSDVARVFYTKPHTLDGLAGASASTFPATDDGLLVIGGAGYATALAVLTVPASEVQVASDRLLKQFRESLTGK